MLANQIMQLRKKSGMSQLQLAQKLNVGPSAIGMYEQGRRTPMLNILIQMAKLFDVSLDYLVTGTETMNLTTHGNGEDMCPTCPCRLCRFCCNKLELPHNNFSTRGGLGE